MNGFHRIPWLRVMDTDILCTVVEWKKYEGTDDLIVKLHNLVDIELRGQWAPFAQPPSTT
jgi:hypothetical protein